MARQRHSATLDDVMKELRGLRRDFRGFTEVLEVLVKHGEVVNVFMARTADRLNPKLAEKPAKPETVH